MQCTKQLSQRRSALVTWWVWPTEMLTCEIWINDIPPTPDAIGVNFATPKWSPRVLYANHSYNAWSGSSQHCPKSRRDPRDDRLFHWLYPGQFQWWSMPRITFTKRKPYRITCRITRRLRLQCRIMITLLPRHDGHRQSIWWRRRRRSNEFSEGGDNHLYTIKFYQQLQSPRGGNLPRHVPCSRPVKSYRQVDMPTGRQSTKTRTEESTKKSTEKLTNILQKSPMKSAPMKSTRWSPKRTLNDDYRVNVNYQWLPSPSDILRGTARRPKRAQACSNSVGITILKKLTCEMSTNDMPLTYTMDDYQWLRTMPAAEAPIDAKSWEEALLHWWFRQWPTPRYTGYGYGWLVEYGLGSQDMETGLLGDVSCFSLLFLSSLDLGPVQMASAWVFTMFGVSQVEVDFPRALDPPKCHPQQ